MGKSLKHYLDYSTITKWVMMKFQIYNDTQLNLYYNSKHQSNLLKIWKRMEIDIANYENSYYREVNDTRHMYSYAYKQI